jgi:hypothetical protein
LATVRTVLNRVLIATGGTQIDPAVTDITDADTLLKLEFLNQIKEEIEDAHLWRALRQTLTPTVLANTNSIPLTGTNGRSRLWRIPSTDAQEFVPLVFDLYDPKNPIQLTEMPLSELLYRVTQDGTGYTTVQPSYFALDTDSTDVQTLYVWNTPSTARPLQVTMHVPQAPFVHTDLDTVIKIPTLPLIRGTVWYVREERGEELGANSAFSEERYRILLDDEISRDRTEQGDPYQLVPV